MPELLFIIKKHGDDLLNPLSIILEVSQQYSATRRIGISQHVTEDLQEALAGHGKLLAIDLPFKEMINIAPIQKWWLRDGFLTGKCVLTTQTGMFFLNF